MSQCEVRCSREPLVLDCRCAANVGLYSWRMLLKVEDKVFGEWVADAETVCDVAERGSYEPKETSQINREIFHFQ